MSDIYKNRKKYHYLINGCKYTIEVIDEDDFGNHVIGYCKRLRTKDRNMRWVYIR